MGSAERGKKRVHNRGANIPPPSLPLQGYLEVIDDICRAHGHAHAKAIADKLGIRMASVTEALRALSAKGFVTYSPRHPVTLTSQGESLALELRRKHRILADFFVMIGCPQDVAREAACVIEHNIDTNIANLIEAHMRKTRGD